MRAGPQGGVCMSPIQTATRGQQGQVRPYPPADVFLAQSKDVSREIVVDWQLPSDVENRRR